MCVNGLVSGEFKVLDIRGTNLKIHVIKCWPKFKHYFIISIRFELIILLTGYLMSGCACEDHWSQDYIYYKVSDIYVLIKICLNILN